MRILFGHQSVGADILRGLQEVSANTGATVLIPDAHGRPLPEGPALLAHFRVGMNGNPHAKLQDFVRAVHDRRADRIDLALFKFCYVDILDDTTAIELFADYVEQVDALQSSMDMTTIAHITVPLRALPRGPVAIARWAFGGGRKEVARNAARHAFNERLRLRYGPEGLLFDLAALESARAGGGVTASARAPALRRDYTSDGGHLNYAGRTVLASAFWRFVKDAGRHHQRA